MEGDADRARAPRSRREEEQGGRWVRDTHPRFEERDGHGDRDAPRPGLPAGSGTATGAHNHGIGREPDASDHPRDVGGGVLGPGDGYRVDHGGTRVAEGRPRPRGTHDGGDGCELVRDGAAADRVGGNDDDGGDGGPARGGGRVASLRPGPGAHGDGAMTDRDDGSDDDGGNGGLARGGGRVANLAGRAPATGMRPMPREPPSTGRSGRAPRSASRREGTTRKQRSRAPGQTGTTPTRTSPRRIPRSRTEIRGDGGGGAPMRGRAAPRTAGGGTGTGGTTATETRGPGGTVAGRERGLGATAAMAVPSGFSRSPHRLRQLSADISRGRSGSRSSSPTRPTPPTPSSALPALGRDGCAVPSSFTRRQGMPSTG